VACQKAAKALHGGKGYFRMAYNGIGPAVIRFSEHDTAFAIVMPMREMTDLDISSIQWAKQ